MRDSLPDAFATTWMQQILDNTPAVVYAKDRDGRFLYVNGQFLNLFRLTRDDVIGRLATDVLDADAAQRFLATDQIVLHSGVPHQFEETARIDDGTVTFLSQKFPLFDACGELFAVCGISTDISARKRQENALHQIALGVSGKPGFNVFEEIVPYLALSLNVDFAFIGELNHDCGNVHTLAISDRGAIYDNITYDIANTPCESVIENEFRFIPEQLLTLYPGESMLSMLGVQSYAGCLLLDAKGNTLGVLAAMHRQPITDRAYFESIMRIFSIRAAAEIERQRNLDAMRASEAQLRQAQKMQAIGQLAGGIAHDFNNVLTGLMGYVSIAEERAQRWGDEKLQTWLHRASQSGQKASALIQQLLTFSRGQRGQPRHIELNRLVGEFVKLMGPSLPASIELQTRLAAGTICTFADPLHIEQILMNLCINARDAMTSHGRIGISVGSDTVHAVCSSCQQTVTGRFATIDVSDTGSGISPQVLERMFEPFFSTKEVGKGSGMGLAMVHGIVHEYGGHVVVHSDLRGSRFRILLPPGEAPTESSGDTSPERKAQRRSLSGHVMVVDDETLVTDFMRDRLEDWGLRVTTINEPEAALTQLLHAAHGIDLLIVDHSMPRLTGIELLRLIGAQRNGMPVLLYSGYLDDIDSDELQHANVQAVLAKPLNLEELYGVLQQHLH